MNPFNLFYYNKSKNEYVRINHIIVIFILIMIILCINKVESYDKEDEIIGQFNHTSTITYDLYNYIDDIFCDSTDINEFSEDKLINYIKDLNLKCPHIVLAQARLETGHYESEVFKSNNNLFGMKEARVRCHTSTGTKYGHAKYDDWRQSVIDYALYQSSYFYDVKNEKQYLKRLNKMNYAESDNYTETIMFMVERDGLKDIFLDK